MNIKINNTIIISKLGDEYIMVESVKDINDKIVELSKEGKSYLWYNFSYITDSDTIDSVVEYLKLYGYHVFKIGSYSIEIKW